MKRIPILLSLVALLPPVSSAAEIRVAVASNFMPAMQALKTRFENITGHRLRLASGSTGRHFAQIINGAPFDAFLAADARRPRLLERHGAVIARSRFTYAIGRLVLWSPKTGQFDRHGRLSPHLRFLAIANPRHAPYGRAAREYLTATGQWRGLQGRIVRGENVAQTWQYVASGNADAGIVAWSLIARPGRPPDGHWWMLPDRLYRPIRQQAVMLRDNPATRALWRFLRSATARRIIASHGYRLP